MKALTIWQLWASLVIAGVKPYEFRHWNYLEKPRYKALLGRRIVIHAGARKVQRREIQDLIYRLERGGWHEGG